MTRTAFVPAEYNPFHEGHACQLKTLREDLGFDRIVTVMSGSFVQRGGPAIYDKRLRAADAVDNGSDLVLLLPYVFSAQTAEMFAWGCSATAHAAGCTDLCCGAEDPGKADLMKRAALVLEDGSAGELIRKNVKDGLSYAAARIKALSEILDEDISFLERSNNILALEYMRAVIRLGGGMKVVLIPRKEGLPSASDIRRKLTEERHEGIRTPDDYISELRSFVLLSDPAYLSGVQEAFGGIVPRLWSALPKISDGTEAFIGRVNTPTVPSSRIRRYLFNMLMGYTKNDFETFRSYVPGYIRVLALNGTGAQILKEIKQEGRTRIVTKPSDALKNGALCGSDRRCFDFDIKAQDLYDIGTGTKGNELRYTPVIK